MNKVLFIGVLFCPLLWSCGNNSEEKTSIKRPFASKHSIYFNNGVDSLLIQYDSLSNAFVNWDSAKVTLNAKALFDKLQNMPLTEKDLGDVKKDSTAFSRVNDNWKGAKSAALFIASSADLDEKRKNFHKLSLNIFSFLRDMQYDNNKLYLHKCTMAFDDTGTGLWISKVEEINNPYLGKHHPRYKAGMLHCGENEEALDLSGVGTVQNSNNENGKSKGKK